MHNYKKIYIWKKYALKHYNEVTALLSMPSLTTLQDSTEKKTPLSGISTKQTPEFNSI